ncbi:MAG: acetyl-CoA carboxylase biotin carboxyl carrier protein [Pseudomonadota bacterium]
MPRKDDRVLRTTAAAARERSRHAEASTSLQRVRSDADIAFVDALAQLLKEHDLAEIELTREYGDSDELKVRLSRHGPAAVLTHAAPAPALAPPPAPTPPADGPTANGVDSAAAAEDFSQHPGLVASPMVGTIYLAPEPGAAQFVAAGATVEQGQTLLIIEAMKTMNQIPSPKSGVVKRLLVTNEQPVEFGAPLVIIE